MSDNNKPVSLTLFMSKQNKMLIKDGITDFFLKHNLIQADPGFL